MFPKRLLLLLTLAAAAFAVSLVLAASACGGGEESAPSDAGSRTPMSTPVSGDAGPTLLEMLTRGLNATYKVTYQPTSPSGDVGDSYIVFNRPPFTRIDIIPSGSSEPSSLIISHESGATVSCSDGPDDWKCFEMAPFDEPLISAAGPFIFFSASDLESLEVSETEGRRIAGQASRCFAISPRQGERAEEIEYCLNSDGVPLYSAPLFGTVEATEFSLDVSEQDFASPVEPQR